MTDCGRSVVAALSRYVSGCPWTDCRSAGNTDDHVVLSSLGCALLRVPSLARTGAARQRPTNRRRLESTSFLLKPARFPALNYFVFGINRTSSSTKAFPRVRIASSLPWSCQTRLDYCNINSIV